MDYDRFSILMLELTHILWVGTTIAIELHLGHAVSYKLLILLKLVGTLESCPNKWT